MKTETITGWCIAIVVCCSIYFGVQKLEHPGKDPRRDYQIEVTQDSIILYDRDRWVHSQPLTDSTAIGAAILKDNL
jgi:hypothetical protein